MMYHKTPINDNVGFLKNTFLIPMTVKRDTLIGMFGEPTQKKTSAGTEFWDFQFPGASVTIYMYVGDYNVFSKIKVWASYMWYIVNERVIIHKAKLALIQMCFTEDITKE
jgi:hypothetical protein